MEKNNCLKYKPKLFGVNYLFGVNHVLFHLPISVFKKQSLFYFLLYRGYFAKYQEKNWSSRPKVFHGKAAQQNLAKINEKRSSC